MHIFEINRFFNRPQVEVIFHIKIYLPVEQFCIVILKMNFILFAKYKMQQKSDDTFYIRYFMILTFENVIFFIIIKER